MFPSHDKGIEGRLASRETYIKKYSSDLPVYALLIDHKTNTVLDINAKIFENHFNKKQRDEILPLIGALRLMPHNS